MWESVSEIIKLVGGKHLIPAVMSIVGGIIALLLVPIDYWMLTKIGKRLFFFLVAGIIFLIVQGIICGINWIKEHSYTKKIRKENVEYSERKLKNVVEQTMSDMDELSGRDRELVRKFIKNGNSPIKMNRNIVYLSDSIYHTNYVVTTRTTSGDELMKLDESFYELIKYIYEEKGKICHFD